MYWCCHRAGDGACGIETDCCTFGTVEVGVCRSSGLMIVCCWRMPTGTPMLRAPPCPVVPANAACFALKPTQFELASPLPVFRYIVGYSSCCACRAALPSWLGPYALVIDAVNDRFRRHSAMNGEIQLALNRRSACCQQQSGRGSAKSRLIVFTDRARRRPLQNALVWRRYQGVPVRCGCRPQPLLRPAVRAVAPSTSPVPSSTRPRGDQAHAR